MNTGALKERSGEDVELNSCSACAAGSCYACVDEYCTALEPGAGNPQDEIIFNSLAHRDYSTGYIAQMVIEKDRILMENGNRVHGIGALDIHSFKPFSKNPAISKIFREIGYADELGSGICILFSCRWGYAGKN